MRFCKTSQISQKSFKMESLFRKTVTSQGCNCTKKDTITCVCLRIYLCEYIFSFLLFCFRESKSNHRKCSVKKSVLKNLANFTGKHLCWRLFLIKLQAFCEHLLTTASKKINICLIVKVLLLCT